MRILVVLFLFIGSHCFSQNHDGPINIPKVDIQEISFSTDSVNNKIHVDSLNNSVYNAYIRTSDANRVNMDGILDSLKNKGNFQLFVYT